MRRTRLLSLRLLCTLGALALPAVAHAGDFVDTRLNLTFTDENLFVGPGETNPSIAGPRFDRPNRFGILFFDNYDTRYSGYENLTHLVLYKKMTGVHFEAEGALVMRFLEFSDINLSVIDDGSYVKLNYYFDATRESKTNFSVTAFPMSSDRMRLGFSYRLSWGGSPIFYKFNPDVPIGASAFVTNSTPAPGVRFAYASDRFYAWAGLKTSLILNRNPQVNEQIVMYGALGGLSVDLIKDHFRFDMNGGYFYRGTNPLMYQTQDQRGTLVDFPVHTYGVSAQLSVFNGLSPTGSLDYALYKNDPTTATRYFTPFSYKPGMNWLVQSEFTIINTTLQDPEKLSSTTNQAAYAGDINVRAQYGYNRFKLDASMRSLEFMLINQPSYVPYQAFPNGAQINPDLFLSIGYDRMWRSIGLLTGLTLGVDAPATFTPPSATPGVGACPMVGGSLCSTSTIVVYGEGDYSILPLIDSMGNGVKALPIFAAKLQLREDFLEYFAVILDVYYTHDPNQTHLTKVVDPASPDYGAELRDFNHPESLGFNLTLQARY